MADTEYIFERHYRSSLRLNSQHHAFTTILGNKLLHNVVTNRIDVSAPLRVAELATGTGIWAIELAGSLPNAQVDGFDISDKQYPPKEWCPSNVTLRVQDSFDPFPAEYHGVYDVVHVRCFMSLLHNEERIETFLKNVMSLLKPGGLFQWFDLNPRTARVVAANSTVKTTATEQAAAMIRGIPPDIELSITDNADLVKPIGFEPLSYEPFLVDDIRRPIWNQCLLIGLEEMADHVESSGDLAKAEAMRKNIEQLTFEFMNGASVELRWFYLIARKP